MRYAPIALALSLIACSKSAPEPMAIEQPLPTPIAPAPTFEAPAAQEPTVQAPTQAAPIVAPIADPAPAVQEIAQRAEVFEEAAPEEDYADIEDLDDVFGSSTLDSDLSSGVGGLVGAKGTQIGAGGLGARGSGLGGGSAANLGGLGTKGAGTGTSSVRRSSRSTPRPAAPSAPMALDAPPPPPPAHAVVDAAPPPAISAPTNAPPQTVQPTQTTERFSHYGLNDMTLVERDGFSTFSIDVDTASYAIARRKLESNTLPPQAAVRVEEFVNYFDYDYDSPRRRAPFAVDMEAAPNPFQANHHVLQVGVQGREAAAMPAAPVHLTFLVDTSGSMQSEDKMGLLQDALVHLVRQLGPDDTVALATYAGHVSRVLSPTPASEAHTIERAIRRLSADGSTAMGSGIDLAYRMAASDYVWGEENRVIVCSDGDANVGPTSHTEILEQIRGYADRGITLSTIGFGTGNYQDTMMEQLANQGDGNYYYIDSLDEAKKVFGQDLSGTLRTIAKDVKIQVEFNPQAVYAYRLIGYENRDIADRDFRNDAVDAGEVGAGHQVTALYDVVLKDDWRDHEIATVRLRNKKPGPDSPAIERETTFPGEAVRSDFDDASRDLKLAFGVASFAELLRGSPYAWEMTYDQIHELLQPHVRGEATERELLTLIETAGRLSGQSIADGR